jgi:hypothetical protein
MLTGSTIVRVVPNPAGGWDVREPGATRALSHAADKHKAVVRARGVMLAGGVVHVLDAEGALLETHTVPGPGEQPWWYAPPRRLTWVVAGGFFVQGVVQVPGRDIDDFRLWLGLATVLLAAFYLTMLIVSRRHDRRLLQPEQ